MGAGRRIRNIISYVLVLLIFLGCYLLLHGAFFVVMDVTLLLLGIFDVVNLRCMKHTVEYTLIAPEKECYQNQRLSVGLKIKNTSFGVSSNVFLTLKLENEFYQRTSIQTYNFPLYMGEDTTIELPFLFENCGKMRISIEKITTTGIMGIVTTELPVTAEGKVFYVFPEKLDLTVLDGKYDSGADRQQYPKRESEQKGEDAMDISGIREYVPGDRIKDIHWKLSAKSDNDKLFIKEHVSQSGDGMYLLVELSETTLSEHGKEKWDNLLLASKYNPVKLQRQPMSYQQEDGTSLDALLNLLVVFLRKTTRENHKLVVSCWNQKKGELEQADIWEEPQILPALEMLLNACAYQESGIIEEKVKGKVLLGDYLWAGKQNEEQRGEIVARGKLATVIQWRKQL